MTLELLDRLSMPGDPAKANEDSYAFFDRAALVLDGATPLGPPLLPGNSDAAWIAQFGARRLLAHLKDGDAPPDAIEHALAEAEKSFAGLARAPIRERWQTPCASLMMAAEPQVIGDPLRPSLTREPATGTTPSSALRARGGSGSRSSFNRHSSTLEFLWFGDCTALIEQEGDVQVIGDALKSRDEEAERARRAAKQMNLTSALGVDRPEIEPLLRAARNRINSGRNWLFSPDVRAARHVSRQAVSVRGHAGLLLASDGFLALVSDYGAYDAASLMRAVSRKGLAALGGELRAIEESDPEGRKFPRFKRSDDATALFFQLEIA